MLEKLVVEMEQIVAEVKSPFSYIHDKLVEAFGHTHRELAELKARVDALEGKQPATMEELHAQANVLRKKIEELHPAPTERVSYPDGTSATGTPPLPDKSPAQQDAEDEAKKLV